MELFKSSLRNRHRFFSLNRLLLFAGVCLVFNNEILEYYLRQRSWMDIDINQLSQLGKPHNRRSAESTTILLVADPQIQGYFGEPAVLGYITRWDADRYLRRTFSSVMAFAKPQSIVFLGDLFDEGSTASDAEYAEYVERFDSIYHFDEAVTKVYIPGDNDVGGERFDDEVTPHKLARFRRRFGAEHELVRAGFVDVVKLSQSFDSAYDEANYEQFVLRAARRGAFRIVVNHLAVLGRGARVFTKPVEHIRPNLVISAHSHRATYVTCRGCVPTPIPTLDKDGSRKPPPKSNTNDAEEHAHDAPVLTWHDLGRSDRAYVYVNMTEHTVVLYEVNVPTCSYRMGEQYAAFGILKLDTDGNAVFYALWLPPRLRALYLYLAYCVLAVLLRLAVWCRYQGPLRYFFTNAASDRARSRRW